MLGYIDRDLIRAFLLTFITLAAFVQIGYFVSVLLEQSAYIFGTGESKLGWILLYYVTSIPRQAAYTFPVATAVSVLWVYTMKARQNEVLAYLAGGISPMRLARPLILMGALFSVLCYLTIEFLANSADAYAYRIERINIQDRSIDTLTRERNVFQKGHGNRFYDVRAFEPSDDTMENTIIIDMGDRWNRPVWRLDAQTAALETTGEREEWVFRDAVFRRWGDDGVMAEFVQDDELTESDLGVQLEGELSRYLRQRFKPAQMGFGQLSEYISLFKDQGKPTHELRSYLHFNFAIPLGSVVLAILMCGHILRPSSTGIVVGFGGGLIIIAMYFILLITCRTMAMTGKIDPIVAAYLPNVLGLIVGIYLLKRYRPAT